MQLTREAIQRMVGTGGMVMGGGGGEGGGISADFLTQNYVAIPYFSQLFTIHGKQTTTVDGEVTDEQDITLPPNTMPSRTETTEGGVTTVVETTITRIEALFDFNSVGGVSALGYNPGGGGGGDTLTEPLASINNASLGMPTAAGQVITWNGTQWIFDIPEGGGGGGTGTVTSITAGTGLSGGTITTMGTIAISSTYQGYISHGETAYGWGNHANAGYLTQSSLSGYATQTWVANQGYATQTWVTGRGYITSAALSGYATQAWVNNQGFLTSETYLGTVTSVKMTVPTGFSVSGSPITTSGTLALSFANGYSLPTDTKQSNWDTAYTRITTGTWWGQSMNSSGVVDGTISVKGGSASGTIDLYQPNVTSGSQLTIRQNASYAEIWNRASTPILVSSGIFGIGIGSTSSITNSSYKLQVAGTAMIGTGYTDTSSGLIIGGAMLKWDNNSKSLYVMQADGTTAANFYATGGVSALGISTGSGGIEELTVNTLKGVRYLQNASGAVSITSGNSYIYIGAGSGSNVYIADSSNTYFDTNGHLHLNGKRLYLDASRYVYVSSGHLYFYNGSSSVQIA